jgi:hypothetical protein
MPQPTIVVITATITIAKFNNWREDPGLVPGLSFARRFCLRSALSGVNADRID